MRLGHFDMNLLVALDALLDTRSVTRASERLHIGASATSSALGRLREYFDDELLMQVGRRMELTPLGRSLAQPVREILLTVQSTVVARLEFNPAQARRNFVIRASDYLTTVLLVDVVQRLQREAPGITLHIANMTDDVQDQLDRGEVDFVIYPSASVSPAHPSQTLFEETFSCIVWSGNALVGETLTLDQYKKMGHVAATFGDSRSVSFESLMMANLGLSRSIEVTTTNYNTLPQLVMGTTRVATVHTRLADIYCRYLPLRRFPLPMKIPPFVEVMQWHAINNSDPAHLWMRRVLIEQSEQRTDMPAVSRM
ncbi:nodulation protein NfeD [Robbsia andropogonis]|uniref:Nodulation protein NfeD n=1 Tax=Robbsia andropogonis TaxID=28092 RepID=A0A0F5JVG9_9BURK|nr:LysR family transcriptional regulator [Robbsia andropogonis]KKB61863.1 nodulation protein NfeD [Robbsia andropogonis]MCP1118661.1 LysR family transcriptional regulator [Robbsia andropogonis]MCP1128128.1 LysR family transcriptional regulator [Robbsia andropogonis]